MEKNTEKTNLHSSTRASAFDSESNEIILATAFENPPPLSFEPSLEKKEDKSEKIEIAPEVAPTSEAPQVSEMQDSAPENKIQQEKEEAGEEEQESIGPELVFASAAPEPPNDDNNEDSGSSSGSEGGNGDDEPIQKKEDDDSKISTSTSDSKIPSEVLEKMEGSMNADFSNVKININSSQAKDAKALAFAKGNTIDFAPGQYNPNSKSGQELLGHELAHVVQQREGRVKPTKTINGAAVNDDPGLEKEADTMGAKAASSNAVGQLKKKQEDNTISQSDTIQKTDSTISSGTTSILQPSTTYDVSGSYREVKSGFAQPGEEGSISTNISSIQVRDINRGRNLRLELVVTIAKSMPNWIDLPAIRELANNDDEVHQTYYQRIVNVYTNFIASLDAHEEAHKTIDLRHYRNVHRRFRGKTEAQINDEIIIITKQASALHEAFHESPTSAIMVLPPIQRPAERMRPSDVTSADNVQYKEVEPIQKEDEPDNLPDPNEEVSGLVRIGTSNLKTYEFLGIFYNTCHVTLTTVKGEILADGLTPSPALNGVIRIGKEMESLYSGGGDDIITYGMAEDAKSYYKTFVINNNYCEMLKVAKARTNLIKLINDSKAKKANLLVMQSSAKDGLRAMYKKKDEDGIATYADLIANILDSGLAIQEIASETISQIKSLTQWANVANAGGKMPSADTKMSKLIGIGNKINYAYAALSTVLSAINIINPEGGSQAQKANSKLSSAVSLFGAAGTLVGASAATSLYANLHLGPMTEACMSKISSLQEKISKNSNRRAIERKDYDNVNWSLEQGGRPMFNFMLATMHASGPSSIPRPIPSIVAAYLVSNRDLLDKGTGSKNNNKLPTKGLVFKDLDENNAANYVYHHRHNLWAMFYGDCRVPQLKKDDGLSSNGELAQFKIKIPSNVNVHQNSSEATSMGAQAFALGNDIHFAPGQFKPETTQGQQLIGHELKHVQQQKAGKVMPTNLQNGQAINDDPALEKEADDFGKSFVQKKNAPSAPEMPAIQMKSEGGVIQKNDQNEHFKAELKKLLQIEGESHALLSFIDNSGIFYEEIYKACKNASFSSAIVDQLYAAIVYTVAADAGHSTANDVQSGKITVNAISKNDMKNIGHADGDGMYSTIDVPGTSQKADTLYLKIGPTIQELDFRALIIHELEHALDDKNSGGPQVLPSLEFEVNGYKAQAKYLLDQFKSASPENSNAIRLEIVKVLKSNLGKVMGLCIVINANVDTSYDKTVVDLLTNPPMTLNSQADIEALIAMGYGELMKMIEDNLVKLFIYKKLPPLVNVDGLAPVQKKETQINQDHTKQERAIIPDGVNVVQNSAKATKMGALAYAQGSDIHFAPGQYNPNTISGKQLIGHELTHVKQQKQGRVQSTKTENGTPVNDSHALEKEADQGGVQFAQGNHIDIGKGSNNGPVQLKSEEWKQVYKVPYEYKMTASLNMGLVFTPIDKSGAFIQNVDKFEQQVIYAFKTLSSKYTEELAEAFLKKVMSSPHGKIGRGMPKEDERLTGLAFNIPSISLINNFLSEHNLTLNITKEQKNIIEISNSIDQLWPNVSEYLMSYKWFNVSLFKVLVANKQTLLNECIRLNTKISKKDSDASDTEIDRQLDAENELVDPIFEKEAIIDKIRQDEKLISMWEYKLLWEQKFGSKKEADDKDAVAPENKINFRCAIEVFNILSLHKGKAAAAAKSSKEGTEARKEILKYMAFVLGKSSSSEFSDSVLSDQKKQANLPAFPSKIAAVPPLKNYRTGTRSERNFRLSVRFDDIYDALGATFNPNFNYRFDLIKIPDDKVREYMKIDKKNKVSDVDKALAAGKVAKNSEEKSEGIGGWSEMTNKWGRRNKYLNEDLETAIDYMEESVFHSVAGRGLVDAALIGHGLGYVGDVIDSFITSITEPSHEEKIPFKESGFYIVRASAGLSDTEDDMMGLRPPSFAWMPVYVESAGKIAHDEKSNLSADQERIKSEIKKIKEKLAEKGLSEEKKKIYEKQLIEFQLLVSGSAGDIHSSRLKDLETEREKQKNLKSKIARIEKEVQGLKEQLAKEIDKTKKEGLQEKIDKKIQELKIQRNSAKSKSDLKKMDESIKDMTRIKETSDSRYTEFGLKGKELESPVRIPATFTQDDGNQIPLMLDVFPTRFKNGKTTYYASDITHKKAQGEKGDPSSDRNEGIKSAIVNLLRSPDNYGRGYVSLLIPAPSPNPEKLASHKTVVRIKPDELGIIFTGIESLITIAEIAAVAAAPFTGGSSLSLLVPLGIVGSIPAAYRLYNAADDNIFDWSDPATILDIIDVVGSLAGIGSKVTKGFKLIPLSQGFAIVDVASGKFGMLVGGVNFLVELHKISSDKTLSEGEKKARIAKLIGNQLKSYGVMGVQKHYENASKAKDTSDIDPKKLTGPDQDQKQLPAGSDDVDPKKSKSLPEPKPDTDVDSEKKKKNTDTDAVDDSTSHKKKTTGEIETEEKKNQVGPVPLVPAKKDKAKKAKNIPDFISQNKDKIAAGNAATMLDFLNLAGSWKSLIQTLETGGHKNIADQVFAFRSKIITNLIAKAGGNAKELDDASKENVSDVDLNFTGDVAGKNLLDAESFMKEKYGESWSKLLRLNFYTDASRLKKVLDSKANSPQIEKAIALKSAELNFAKMLILANDKAAKKRIIRLMDAAGIDYAKVKPHLKESKATRDKKRQELHLEIDELVQKHAAADEEVKNKLALEITEKQMLLNFYSDEAYISPGSMTKGKKSDALAFSDMTSQLQMIEETISKAGGDPIKALREYEMYKYMFRFAEAVHHSQLDLFMNYLNEKFYKKDRQGPGSMSDVELAQVWNRFRQYSNKHLQDRSPLKAVPEVEVKVKSPEVKPADNEVDKQLPLFTEKESTAADPEKKTMAGRKKLPEMEAKPDSDSSNLPESHDDKLNLLNKFGKGFDQKAKAPKKHSDASKLPEAHSTFAKGILDADVAHLKYEEALQLSNGREVAIFYKEKTGEYIVRIGDESYVSPGESGFRAIVHFHPNEGNTEMLRLPAPADFYGAMIRFLNNGGTERVREFVESHVPGKGRSRVEYGFEPHPQNHTMYVIIHSPDGFSQKVNFSNDGNYEQFWSREKIYVEPGSTLHHDMLQNLEHYRKDLKSNGPYKASDSSKKTAVGIVNGPVDPYRKRHITETEHLRDDQSNIVGGKANPLQIAGTFDRKAKLESSGDGGSISAPSTRNNDGSTNEIPGCGVFKQYIRLPDGSIVQAAIKVYPRDGSDYESKISEDIAGASIAEATGIGPKVFGYIDIGEPDKIAFAMQVVKGNFVSHYEGDTPEQTKINKAQADAAAKSISGTTYNYLEAYRERLLELGYYYSGELQGLVHTDGSYNPIDFQAISVLPSDPSARAAAIEGHNKKFKAEANSLSKAHTAVQKKSKSPFQLKSDPISKKEQELEPFKL